MLVCVCACMCVCVCVCVQASAHVTAVAAVVLRINRFNQGDEDVLMTALLPTTEVIMQCLSRP